MQMIVGFFLSFGRKSTQNVFTKRVTLKTDKLDRNTI